MNHDPLEAGMFWAGAVMAFTPIILGAIVLAIWWIQRRKARKQ